MSIPLKDFRVAIPELVDVWLDAVATAHKTDKAAIAREVLQEWADMKAHEHSVALRRLASNGLQASLPGFLPDEDGGPRMRSRK